MAKVQPFVFKCTEIWRQVWERIVIKIGTLKTFPVDIHQVEFWIGNGFGGLFIIRGEIRVAIARLGFYQLGYLMKRRAGIDRPKRQHQCQQTVTHMVRMVTATAKDPPKRPKHRNQRHSNTYAW
ncbi:hypothetical protein D3C80_830610 [compost metagenome]